MTAILVRRAGAPEGREVPRPGEVIEAIRAITRNAYRYAAVAEDYGRPEAERRVAREGYLEAARDLLAEVDQAERDGLMDTIAMLVNGREG